MRRKHRDGSAKGDCHIAQVLLPPTEHQAQSGYARRLGLSFSGFARVAMRVASEPDLRARVADEQDRLMREQRGEETPRFQAYKTEEGG